MASTSSFLTVALVVVLLGAASTCHAEFFSLAEQPLPAVPDVPDMPKTLVDLLINKIMEVLLLPVPNSNVLRPEEELVPIVKDLVQELELIISTLEEVLFVNSEVLRPEKELSPVLSDLMTTLKNLVETLKDLIPSLSSVPPPKDIMPILANLLEEMKLLTPSAKDLIPTLNLVVPILKRTTPLIVDQLQEVKLLIAILKEPNSKVLIPEKEVMLILRDMLRDIKFLRVSSKVLLRPEIKLMSNLLNLLKGP